MEYSLKKLSKTFDQKLTRSIQKPIRIRFVSFSSIPAGDRNRKKTLKTQCFFVGLAKMDLGESACMVSIVENENNQFHLLSKCGLP